MKTARIDWRRSLDSLLPALLVQLQGRDKPERAVACLPRGAFVELRLEEGRRIVRVFRLERPETPEQHRGWDLEVQTFEKYLGVARWRRQASPVVRGVAVAWYEPVAADAAPQLALD